MPSWESRRLPVGGSRKCDGACAWTAHGSHFGPCLVCPASRVQGKSILACVRCLVSFATSISRRSHQRRMAPKPHAILTSSMSVCTTMYTVWSAPCLNEQCLYFAWSFVYCRWALDFLDTYAGVQPPSPLLKHTSFGSRNPRSSASGNFFSSSSSRSIADCTPGSQRRRLCIEHSYRHLLKIAGPL
jgi:hypothetical protein